MLTRGALVRPHGWDRVLGVKSEHFEVFRCQGFGGGSDWHFMASDIAEVI